MRKTVACLVMTVLFFVGLPLSGLASDVPQGIAGLWPAEIKATWERSIPVSTGSQAESYHKQLAYSPKGDQIAVANGALSLISVQDGKQTPIAGFDQATRVAWHPDGQRVAVGETGAKHTISLYDLSSGRKDTLPSEVTGDLPFLDVAWHPSGKLLTFRQDNGIVNLDESNRTTWLAGWEFKDGGQLSWSLDGKRLFRPSGSILDRQGDSYESGNRESDYPIVMSPDGQFLLTVQVLNGGASAVGIRRLPPIGQPKSEVNGMGPTEARLLINDNRPPASAAWSPDGTHLAFLRDGGIDIYALAPASGAPYSVRVDRRFLPSVHEHIKLTSQRNITSALTGAVVSTQPVDAGFARIDAVSSDGMVTIAATLNADAPVPTSDDVRSALLLYLDAKLSDQIHHEYGQQHYAAVRKLATLYTDVFPHGKWMSSVSSVVSSLPPVEPVKLTADVAPLVATGRTLVPLRTLTDWLGVPIKWNGQTKTITAGELTPHELRAGKQVACDNSSSDNKCQTERPDLDYPLVLTLGSTTAKVLGQRVTLDVPAVSFNGRTMVPLRFFAETFGVQVKWDGDTRTISLIAGEKQAVLSVPNQTDDATHAILQALSDQIAYFAFITQAKAGPLYVDVNKAPFRYIGAPMRFTGYIFQAVEQETGHTLLLVKVGSATSGDILAIFSNGPVAWKEGDTAVFYGKGRDAFSYTSQASLNLTVPAMDLVETRDIMEDQ